MELLGYVFGSLPRSLLMRSGAGAVTQRARRRRRLPHRQSNKHQLPRYFNRIQLIETTAHILQLFY